MIDKIYYLLYKVLKSNGKNDQSFFNAFLGLCFLEYMNLWSIFGLVNYFFKYRITKDESVYCALITGGIIFIYNYFILWNKKEIIVKKYDNSPIKNGMILIWGLIIFSFSLLYIILEYFVSYHAI
ncbi:hypothetical protein OC25_07955 [Pedobacter kyungheensis]|uniref:Uncharacterized protein n=1 Tax=Pedobacter kyungheensis TaxID=1069985 RepID=A0A0C1DCB1_9SPHI|nr:hypothetical protein OC25_07955 [Pedobacter kyungheensis]